ncbi:protein NRT1/ PTR FAMILY 4.5-like [Diospyros lotus]|uniref:protein NRT1/ PTR FAMILY 4.5-like n=1 Tax=Diospyros lotus TaxID=55363 RepID=UPI002258F4D9|nr:protein NRT1/ PTR FAMILY 4.5-like [Diospyros lotus]
MQAQEMMNNYEALRPWSKRKGGFRACMFVYALAALDSIGSVANMCTMFLYFNLVLQFDLSQSANTFTNYIGSTFLLSIVGGFISDTYLSRLATCLSFGCLQLVGQAMITIQAYSDKLQPNPCGKSVCLKGGEAVFFYSSLCLLALGAGGVRGALPALGADQFDPRDEKGAKGIATYFNGYLLSTTIGSILGVTGVVWISMNKAWYWGFCIGTITSSLGFLLLALGKPFYLVQPRGNSPIARVARVITLAIRNRNLSSPQNPDELHEISDKERDPSEEKISHTDQFRCLDKAAIVQDGMNPDPCRVCTVTQVEEVKILTRMLPILASTFIMNTCLSQLQTFSVMQGYRMDTHLGSFEIPSASIPVIPLIFMSILIPAYEFLVVPFARKLTGHPAGITHLQRVGVGLVLSAVSMGIAGIVEVKRRDQALKDPLKPISLFWLSFQYGIFGIADMFTMVGLLEFFYKEAPSGMRSLSTSFAPLSLSFGAFLSTVLVNLINTITKSIAPSKMGWLHGKDLNDNNLNLFYWFLAILSCINFANYVFWASWYKYKEDASEPQMEAKGPK